jgi:hypothetical protein
MTALAAEQADWEACIEALALCEARVTKLRQADVSSIANGLADLLSEARYELGEVRDKAPRRPHDYPPWRDDPADVRQFEREVESARAALWRLVDGIKGAAAE